MSSASNASPRAAPQSVDAKRGLLRDPRDRLPIALVGAHALALCARPSWLVVGLLVWWNANTVAHQATHRRMFHAPLLDAALSAVLTLLLGVPQRLWRSRHRAHHRGGRARAAQRRTGGDAQLAGESALLAASLVALGALAPEFLMRSYVPGVVAGLALCALHGRGEHLGGRVISCYGRLWNLFFLNDGYHVEHHRSPGLHYRDLPAHRLPSLAPTLPGEAQQDRAGARLVAEIPVAVRASRLPPPLRALRVPWLDWLERLVLASPLLQRLTLAAHRPALARLLAEVPAPRRVVVVGGGLFPRTALLLLELLPGARIVVLDAEPEHLRRAASRLPASVQLMTGKFAAGSRLDCELAVLPLALRGDRALCYARPPAPSVIVHDWWWRRRGARGAGVPWLLKRLNLVQAVPAEIPVRGRLLEAT